MDAGAGDYSLVASGRFYDLLAGQPASFVDTALYDSARTGAYDAGVETLFGALHVVMSDTYAARGGSGGASALVGIVLLVVVLVVVFSVVDGIRYSLWFGRYGHMGVPPVVYRPILWWHRPGSAWYRRRRNPPPRGPRGPGGFGGSRPPMGGGRPVRPGLAASAAAAGAALAAAMAAASGGGAAAVLAVAAAVSAAVEAGASAAGEAALAAAVAAALAAADPGKRQAAGRRKGLPRPLFCACGEISS